MAENSTSSELPPAAIELASIMYEAARTGQSDILEQALTAGLPTNMTNEKGDTLVCSDDVFDFATLY